MHGQRGPSRATALLPAGVLAVLGGLLVARRQSLWYDELYTAEVSRAGLGDLLRAVVDGTGTTGYLADVPPSYNAPYYVVVHAWLGLTRLEAGEVSLRLLSLLAAVGGVAVLARAVQRLAGPAAGLVAGLLAATSPLTVEYSAEARGYGLAVLATAGTALGLARWLDGARWGLPLFGLAATATGLLHWFALPVVGALALAALVLRGRRALPVVALAVLSWLPTLALVAVAFANGTGTSVVGRIEDELRVVPVLALDAWTGGLVPLLLAYVAALAVAVRRAARPALVVGGLWLVLPLLAVQVLDLLRPVYVDRYLLPALLGAAVLAGAALAGRRLLAGGLVALSLLAFLPLADRGPREDAEGAVAGVVARQSPGEPVVAADRRAALALDHYAPAGLRRDLLVPPQDAPAGPDVVWLLRQSQDEQLRPSDDDELLRAAGLVPQTVEVFRGSNSDLLLQRWSRPAS